MQASLPVCAACLDPLLGPPLQHGAIKRLQVKWRLHPSHKVSCCIVSYSSKGVPVLLGKSDQVGPRLVDTDVEGVSPSQRPRINSTGVESGNKIVGLYHSIVSCWLVEPGRHNRDSYAKNKDGQSAGDPIFQEAGHAAHRCSRVAGMLNGSLPAYIMVDWEDQRQRLGVRS